MVKQIYVAGNKYDNAPYAKQILEAIERYKPIGLDQVLNPHRPYRGQRHTADGERGKQQIVGLTVRDIRDCLILSFYDASPPENKKNPPKSVEDLPLHEMSLESISQHLMCWIERYMGIYPNI